MMEGSGCSVMGRYYMAREGGGEREKVVIAGVLTF